MCDKVGCKKQGEYELLLDADAIVGVFCKRCGQAALRAYQDFQRKQLKDGLK